MRSVPVAMIWELFRNGWWGLPAALLGANALPGIILIALRHDGPLDPGEESIVVIQVVATLINAVMFAAAIMTAQGRPTRLFAYPVSTATLVAWQLLPGMVLMFVEAVLTGMALNAVFHLGWPLWGPSLFLACGLAAVQAALWLTEKSAWLLPGLVLVSGALGTWYLSRFGLVITRPVHLWQEVTPADTMTMLTVAVLSYVVAVEAVSRDRCGEALRTEALRAWFQRVFDSAPAKGLPFRSPHDAQFWYEWRQKGMLPAMTVFSVVIGLCGWALFNRDTAVLHEISVSAGYFLPILAGVIGLGIGSTGPADGNLVMGQFLATRPMTDVDLSRALLKTAARNVIASWVIWFLAVTILSLILWAANALPARLLPPEMEWWYIPGLLVGSWTSAAVASGIVLTGRPNLLAALILGLPTLLIGGIMLDAWVIPRNSLLRFHQFMLVAYSSVFLLGTVWAYVAALRREMVQMRTVMVAAGVWAVAAVLLVLDWSLHGARTVPVQVLMAGFAALAVVPPALTPLALAWNRHR